jgi:sterol 3beta-glucosyltransferase
MKITIVASGSRGDVQPYVALGKGLREAGHEVRLLSTQDFEALVTGAGLEFMSTGTSIEQMLQNPEWRQVTESGNFLKLIGKMNEEMKHRAEDFAREMPAAIEGSDLVITGMGGMGGAFSIAEKLNIPVILAYLFPFTPTRAFPAPLFPRLPLGQVLNPLSFQVLRQVFWQSTRTADVHARKRLGLPKASFWGPYGALDRRRVPTIYGYSRHVLPDAPDWGDHIRVTGFWFLEPAPDWTPPDGLTDFLQAGPPPVYIGFGSMGSRNPEEATQLTLKAVDLSGQRAVLASGWGGLSSADLPDQVYMLSSVPHSWLFPQTAAVVHHGGVGTTAAGLRAGVPSIVVPFMADQPYWGQRVHNLGVGPAYIPRKRLTAEKLAAAITQAVSDAGMRQRAAALGEHIRAEDGIGQAVAAIQQYHAH